MPYKTGMLRFGFKDKINEMSDINIALLPLPEKRGGGDGGGGGRKEEE